MIEFFEPLWQVTFEALQQVFNIDNFLGFTMGYLVIIVSTFYILGYIFSLIIYRK